MASPNVLFDATDMAAVLGGRADPMKSSRTRLFNLLRSLAWPGAHAIEDWDDWVASFRRCLHDMRIGYACDPRIRIAALFDIVSAIYNQAWATFANRPNLTERLDEFIRIVCTEAMDLRIASIRRMLFHMTFLYCKPQVESGYATGALQPGFGRLLHYVARTQRYDVTVYSSRALLEALADTHSTAWVDASPSLEAKWRAVRGGVADRDTYLRLMSVTADTDVFRAKWDTLLTPFAMQTALEATNFLPSALNSLATSYLPGAPAFEARSGNDAHEHDDADEAEQSATKKQRVQGRLKAY